jgi:hypothetical protein
MRSPYNPLAEDIRRWAFDVGAEEPVQDWDLILADVDQDELFLELASDDACPKADYFLALLYLIVGDAVRTDYVGCNKDRIEALLKKSEASFPKRCIYLWAKRSKHLIAHPEAFQYDDWCAGFLARKQDEA